MARYKGVPQLVQPEVLNQQHSDSSYWSSYEQPVLLKDYGSVTSIATSSQRPYRVATSAQSLVQVYDASSRSAVFSFNKFKRECHGVALRADGSLLGVGTDRGSVRLLGVENRAQLRQFKGHGQAVKRLCFSPNNTLVSFSDDRSIRVWDIAAEKQCGVIADAHSDYIRAGVVCSKQDNLLVSGSYDGLIKCWDTRTTLSVQADESTQPDAAMTLAHGEPVEELLLFPNEMMLASAAGKSVKIWDLVAGRCICTVVGHSRTVTSLSLCCDNRRLLSGGLDRLIRVYDVSTFEPVHTLYYPFSVLSLGVTPGDEVLAVGLTDKLLSWQKRRKEAPSDKPKRGKGDLFFRYAIHPESVGENEVLVKRDQTRWQKPKAYEVSLRKFKFSEALDLAFCGDAASKRPGEVISILRELYQRRGYAKAISGRNGKRLRPLLEFLTAQLGHSRYMRYVIDLCSVTLQVLESTASQRLDGATMNLLKKLREATNREIESMKLMSACLGAMEMRLSSTDAFTSSLGGVIGGGGGALDHSSTGASSLPITAS